VRAIRDFFHSRGFVETETPSLVVSPGMEPHIRPMKVEGMSAYLPTSPEFSMKKWLARGYERIFQVCRAYRAEPVSSTHNPEFTILEWYRADAGYEEIMDDVEALFHAISARVTPPEDVVSPWPRMTIEECFMRFAEIDLARVIGDAPALARACRERGWASAEILAAAEAGKPGIWDDLFFLVMMNAVEPALARLKRPVIVHLYPESQAALSNLVTDERGLRWAKRFEVYAGGFELGNAFDELTDPREQRERFAKDMRLRREIYGDDFKASPVDEEFLAALAKMPRAGGIAMGVDRLAMYFTGAKDISEVLWGPSAQ
jgi:lysyl-tRNA synthetase class 2